MIGISQSVQDAINKAAAAIGVPPQWLYNEIRLESGFDPAAENSITHAKGLIQFMPDTARGLGYKDQFDLYNQNPTAEQQLLGPVIQYFKPWGPFKTEQSFYMSVFYPALRNAPADTLFPAMVQKANPGIKTVGDYIKHVNPKIFFIMPLAVIALIGIVGIILKKISTGA
ncbi:MAG: transglycosylase SLT domain-containing protein [Chitinivibrionales bacterium]